MNKNLKTYSIHIGLFLVTLITTTTSWMSMTHGASLSLKDFTWQGTLPAMTYAVSFLFILTAHEFGHYFTAVFNRVRTSLPYYIPLPPVFLLGTMGAVIRIRSIIQSKQQHFDIGIAGPIAGFIAALGVLLYAFTHLPPPEYIFSIHPEYAQYGLDYANHVYEPGVSRATDMVLGRNLVFLFFEKYVADPARVPNPHELMHFPLLFAAFFSLVFTSLNLLPIGQLDGGHVLYGLVGYRNHRTIASIIFVLLLFFAGLGFVNPANSQEWFWRIPVAVALLFYCISGTRLSWQNSLIAALVIFLIQFLLARFAPFIEGYPGWAVFLLIIRRVVGIEHPPAMIEAPLSTGRKILGWIALLIFIVCFTPSPISIIDPAVVAP